MRALRFNHVVVRIAICAIGWRLASVVIALFARIVFPDRADQGAAMAGIAGPWWEAFTRYDSGASVQVARTGFHYLPGAGDTLAQFPVYPLLTRYVGRAIGRGAADLYLGGIIVSWTAFVVAMVALYYLARLDLPRPRAERAVLLTAIFPFAFVFGLVSSDSTFLMFAVLTFYFFRTRRWIAGGVSGAFATAAHAGGILMLPALIWMVWRTAGQTSRERAMAGIGLLLVTCGVGAYSVFVYQLTAIPGGSSNPFEWAASWRAPFDVLWRLVTDPAAYAAGDRLAPYQWVNRSAAVFFLAAVPFVWRRLGAAFGLFMIVSLGLPVWPGLHAGIGRDCAVLFPCFIWLGSLRSRGAVAAVAVMFAMLYSLGLILFTNVTAIS